ncbi:N6-adenosine-methyltransferase IME4 [Culex quinquefasciatus]|uniref:N6-adenosine-methyltransferase IME4 n=1 Tax=Culex quinquefasciatus TaxID=7176 RepID=B0X5H1_CULQU|nr:N6-adenosine-methyltransferase IME4 [Culex quinquefasciatus]|eukprot:XP_001864893.1 N6-adenosine-methyltransferase IME4 [Culex quinquefasciatus]
MFDPETSLLEAKRVKNDPCAILYPSQLIQCDLRYLEMNTHGNFDDGMRQLVVPALQPDGHFFLWITGRAMKLVDEHRFRLFGRGVEEPGCNCYWHN